MARLARSKAAAYGDLFTAAREAHKWDDLYQETSTLFNHNMALRRDRICELVRDRYSPDAEILDLGCGAGVVMEQLIEKGFRITGADRSPDMLNLSRQRLSRFPSETHRLHLGSCESLPFADERFDAILCVGVFGYIDDVVGALLEIRRVLRPRGLLVISVRNPFNTVLSDPVQLLRFLGRKLVRGLSKLSRRPPGALGASASDPQRPPQFEVGIRQNPAPLIRGVTRCGYELTHFAGFGFGPVAIAGNQLLPDRWSIALSDFLGQALDRLGLQAITRSVGDVSIYAFTKT